MSEIFDEQGLMDSVDGDIEFLEETITMLEEDSPALLDLIRSAAASGDAEALVSPAHALKGMLGNFRAAPAESAAREVEMMAREQQLSGIEPAVDTLQKETGRLRDALHDFLQARRT